MDHVITVQAMYEAFGRGDVAAILEHLAVDIAWDQDAPAYGVPIYEPGTGKAHVERFFAALQSLAGTASWDRTASAASGRRGSTGWRRRGCASRSSTRAAIVR